MRLLKAQHAQGMHCVPQLFREFKQLNYIHRPYYSCSQPDMDVRCSNSIITDLIKTRLLKLIFFVPMSVFVLMHWLCWEPLCEPIFMYFFIKTSIGTQGEVGGCKSALSPRWFILLTVIRRCCSYSLLLCGLFSKAICFMSNLVLFCSCVFQSF